MRYRRLATILTARREIEISEASRRGLSPRQPPQDEAEDDDLIVGCNISALI